MTPRPHVVGARLSYRHKHGRRRAPQLGDVDVNAPSSILGMRAVAAFCQRERAVRAGRAYFTSVVAAQPNIGDRFAHAMLLADARDDVAGDALPLL